MIRPLKCRKLSEAEEQENIDRISRLPDKILGHMLSFLPTKCAVGTSILSTRWRYLHMFTDCLSFECPYIVGPKKKKKAQKSGFKKFVNRVLLLHKVSPIKKFHLSCKGHTYDDSYLRAWISAALSKEVEQIRLCFEGQLNALPHRLFNHQTIVELEIISQIKDFRFPESIKLPSLKVFSLMNVDFLDTDTFDSFFPACPLLEELEIRCCYWPMNTDRHVRFSSAVLKRLVIVCCEGWVEINAPNLTYLKYTGAKSCERALLLKNADHLVTADLDFYFMDDPDLIQSALALIKAVYLVKELKLLSDSVQVKYLACFEDDHMPSYPNLVKLSLGYCSYDTWKYITHWLAYSPRLETLVFEQGLIIKSDTREEKWPRNVELVPFSSGVRVIEAYDFHGDTTELLLLEYLLRNAKILEKLILNTKPGSTTKKQVSQMTNKLSMLQRASSTCAIQLWEKKLY